MAHEFKISTLPVAIAASIYQRVYGRILMDQMQGKQMSMMAQSVLAYGMRAFLVGDTFGFREPIVTWGNRCAMTLYVVCLHLAVKAVHMPRNAPVRLGGYRLNNMLHYLGAPTLHNLDVLQMELEICDMLDWDIVPVLIPEDTRQAKRDARGSPCSVLMEQA